MISVFPPGQATLTVSKCHPHCQWLSLHHSLYTSSKEPSNTSRNSLSLQGSSPYTTTVKELHMFQHTETVTGQWGNMVGLQPYLPVPKVFQSFQEQLRQQEEYRKIRSSQNDKSQPIDKKHERTCCVFVFFCNLDLMRNPMYLQANELNLTVSTGFVIEN